MKWLHFCHHLEQQACKDFAQKLQEAFLTQFLLNIHSISNKWLRAAYKLTQEIDHHVKKFLQLLVFWITWLELLKNSILEKMK